MIFAWGKDVASERLAETSRSGANVLEQRTELFACV